ncbi:response regulator [Haloarcula salinisoli]|uniref:Response regulator n=1 Tax=Haloarcula salinisoli TaxID=2487746 RepID=A0A8J8C915_9EURY|nr:response regulator [Halomicroarcula salinisoli]MBX0287307.1 response regulator [Halomicroarcula salinisoli]MBX0305126.1 response regulator [Halomicroarcula salinisoli]
MSIDVLLVDEDSDVLEIVQTFLEQEDDLDVTSEADPETGLEMALSGEYDVVVSDYKMPRLDGLELCGELRDRDRSLPFLLFSAREPDDVRPAADEAGVTGFVQKGTGTEQYSELAEKIRAAT